MNAKKSSTLQRWVELTYRPRSEVCHHATPPTASSAPVSRTTAIAARVRTPNT
jgi:hypothetical protein